MNMFADTWSNPAAFDVNFQFKKNINLREITIYYQGELPNFVIKLPNSKEVKCEGDFTTQVLKKTIKLSVNNVKEFTIAFQKRKPNNKFTISEIDVWSSK